MKIGGLREAVHGHIIGFTSPGACGAEENHILIPGQVIQALGKGVRIDMHGTGEGTGLELSFAARIHKIEIVLA